MGQIKRTTRKPKKAPIVRVTEREVPKKRDKFIGRRRVTDKDVRNLQRAIEKKRNYFIGQEQANDVIRWLEDPERRPFDEVEQLIDLETRFKSGDVLLAWKVVEYANSVANQWEVGYAPRLTPARVLSSQPTMDTRVAKPKQSLALMKAMELLEQNLLHRVRRCRLAGCGKWFYAVLEKAMYHTDGCRVQAVSATPEYRERKRKYMRERRKRQMKGGK